MKHDNYSAVTEAGGLCIIIIGLAKEEKRGKEN